MRTTLIYLSKMPNYEIIGFISKTPLFETPEKVVN